MALEAALAGVIGLLIGSFVNVVAYRVPRSISVVKPRSSCPACGHLIRGADNIPIFSWLWLRGRCRSCRAPISARYPLVEATTGSLFAAIAGAVGKDWAVVGLCVLGATIIALVVIDVDRSRLPVAVAFGGATLGVALVLAASATQNKWGRGVEALFGLAIGALVVVFAQSPRGRNWFSKLVCVAPIAAPWGAWLGWFGLVSAAAGVATAGAVATLLIVVERRTGHSVAMSPAVLTGALVALALSVV